MVEVEGKLLHRLHWGSGHDVSKYFDCLKTLAFDGHKANEMRNALYLGGLAWARLTRGRCLLCSAYRTQVGHCSCPKLQQDPPSPDTILVS
jgi:hypothetical protein